MALQLSSKAMKETGGPDGLVLPLLMFGTVPRLQPQSTPLLSNEDRMKATDIVLL